MENDAPDTSSEVSNDEEAAIEPTSELQEVAEPDVPDAESDAPNAPVVAVSAAADDVEAHEAPDADDEASLESEPAEPSTGQPSVDDLEVRLDAIEAAMQQLQAGDISGAESAIDSLEGEPA